MYMYFYAFVWFVFTPFVYYRALFFHMLLSLVLSVWVVHVPVSDMDCVVWNAYSTLQRHSVNSC